jgi:hypothetical protein
MLRPLGPAAQECGARGRHGRDRSIRAPGRRVARPAETLDRPVAARDGRPPDGPGRRGPAREFFRDPRVARSAPR